jgi:hypothetical protein
MVFLIRYDRRAGTITSLQAFHDIDRAIAESKRLEMELAGDLSSGSNEIVLLEAKSEADLRKTHRRYFESAQELVKSAADEAASR